MFECLAIGNSTIGGCGLVGVGVTLLEKNTTEKVGFEVSYKLKFDRCDIVFLCCLQIKM